MDLNAWRKQQQTGQAMETPSGLVVKLRTVSLLDLALQGDIPAPLTAQVNHVLDKGVSGITVENAKELEGAINLLVKAAVAEPAITDEPDENTLGVHELPIVDRLAIFKECSRYGDRLKPFRPE